MTARGQPRPGLRRPAAKPRPAPWFLPGDKPAEFVAGRLRRRRFGGSTPAPAWAVTIAKRELGSVNTERRPLNPARRRNRAVCRLTGTNPRPRAAPAMRQEPPRD